MFADGLDGDGQPVFRQYVVDQLAPFYDYHFARIAYYFRQFIHENACVTQAVKVEVVERETARMILTADSEGGTGNGVGAAQAAGYAAYQCGFAAAKVADEFDHLAATQPSPESFAEPLGSVGAGGGSLPGLYGTHMLRIVARQSQLLQVSKGALA